MKYKYWKSLQNLLVLRNKILQIKISWGPKCNKYSLYIQIEGGSFLSTLRQVFRSSSHLLKSPLLPPALRVTII